MEVLTSIPAGLWAILGTIIGTIGLSIINKWLAKNIDRMSERTQFINEIKDCNLRIDVLEAEVETWRRKTYEAQEAIALLRREIIDKTGRPPDGIPQDFFNRDK